MVGGLIQQKEIGIFQGKFCQRQPASLATGKHTDLLENIITGKEILPQVTARLTRQHLWSCQHDLLNRRMLGIQTFMRLGKIPDLERCARDHFPAHRFQLLQDGFQECRFSGAIWADQSRTLTPAQFDIRCGEQDFFRITHNKTFRTDDQVPGTLLGAEMQVQARRPRIRQVQGPDAALGFLHPKGGCRDGDIIADFQPAFRQHSFHPHLLDRLDDAGKPAQFPLCLGNILAGDIPLDVIDILEQFFLLALEGFLAVLPARLALLQVCRIIAAISLQ